MNSRVIARNSIAYGFEIAVGIAAGFATAIAMARVLGPEKLGYFNFVMWLTNMSGIIGSIGIPTTERKYMAEYLGRGEDGAARAIFFSSLRIQSITAAIITSTGLVLIFTVSDPAYRLISTFQVLSVLPAMLVGIPAQANMAAENMRANVPGGVIGQILYCISVALSLIFGWNLLGIAVGIFVYRSVEFLVRMVPVLNWIHSLPVEELTPELRRKMWSFSGQGTVLMILNVVVWDRSDMVFLKWLNRDIAQISFFSAGFGLTEKLLLLPQIFTSALGASLMAQYGRDRSRLPGMVVAAGRYILLFSAPALLGAAALSSAVVPIIYGNRYLPAIPVLAVAAILAIPRSLLQPPQQALQATENQGFLVWWGCVCGTMNIALDMLLIPHFAAVGAAWANGLAQTAGAIGIWVRAWQVFRFRLNAIALLKPLSCTVTMAAAVWWITRPLASWAAVTIGIPAGAAVFLILLRLSRALDLEDRGRLLHFEKAVPAFSRTAYGWLLDFLVPESESQKAAL